MLVALGLPNFLKNLSDSFTCPARKNFDRVTVSVKNDSPSIIKHLSGFIITIDVFTLLI